MTSRWMTADDYGQSQHLIGDSILMLLTLTCCCDLLIVSVCLNKMKNH